MRFVEPSIDLVSITPDAERVIEAAARTCYKSEGRATENSTGPFIRKLLARGHETPLEMASASFRIVCDRGVSHELVRHRLASYCQESTRFCDYMADKHGGEIQVIAPPGLEDNLLLYNLVMIAEKTYAELRREGVSPQLARAALPTCLKTEIVAAANLREWRLILKLRTSPAAHPQMRQIMVPILGVLRQHCPNVFSDFPE